MMSGWEMAAKALAAAAAAYGAKKTRDTSKLQADAAKEEGKAATRALPAQTDAEVAADALRRRLARRQGRKSTQTESLDLAPTGKATGTGGGAY